MRVHLKIRERLKINKKKAKTFCLDMFFLVASCGLGAFALTAVMIPNGLTSGGLTGIVRIVQTYIPIDFSILYYGGSIIILAVVTAFLGFGEGRKIILLSLLYPAVLFVFERFPLQLLEEKDVILAAIFCGVFNGASSGLVFWRGYAFCGTDAVAKVIRKKIAPQMPLSQIMLVLDTAIIICSVFVFSRNIALYALVTQVIFAKTVDFVLYGFETKIVQLEIIPLEAEAGTKYVTDEIGRGVTEVEVTGAYTKTRRKQLVVLCSPRESILVKKFIAGIDQKAFVTVVHVDTVWGMGEGFSDIEND